LICKTYRIPYKYGETIRIKPVSDAHLGNKHCNTKKLKQYLDDDDAYYMSIGDFMETTAPSNRFYRKSGDATTRDEVVDEQIDMAAEYLERHRGRIIGMGDGNHELRMVKLGITNPTKRLCKILGCNYLGYSWLLRLLFYEEKNGKHAGRGRSVIIRGHHGWGGGSRTQGADLTKYSRDVAHWDADIFLYGHVHRLQADRIPRVGMVGDRLYDKPKLIGICGTFLRTYSGSADSTYSEEKGYPPVQIGGLVLNIKPTKQWVKYWMDT